jgi:hypothetical protein
VRGVVACHVRPADKPAGPRPSGVVTERWPHAWRWGSVAGLLALVDKVSQKRQHEHSGAQQRA